MQRDVCILGPGHDRASVDEGVHTFNHLIIAGNSRRLIVVTPDFGRVVQENYGFRGIINLISGRVPCAPPGMPQNGTGRSYGGVPEPGHPRRCGADSSLLMLTRLAGDAALGRTHGQTICPGSAPPMEVPQVSAPTGGLPGTSLATLL